MKTISLIILFLSTHLVFSQRTFEELISDAKKSQKQILITIDIPKRVPELSIMDPIEMTKILCTDGGCSERIPNSFEYAEFTTNDDISQKLINKYSIKHLPINLILDTNGELLLKNNSMFGDKYALDILLPLLSDPITSTKLRKMEVSLKTSTIDQLKYYMSVKRDSLQMTDTEMIDLFVEKASDNDYDRNSQDLILKFVNSANTRNEVEILEKVLKLGNNYIESDYLEYLKPELQKKYYLNLFTTLFFSYRTGNESLLNEKIVEAKKSSLYGEDIELMIQNMLFLYYKATQRPEELFRIVKPSIEKQLINYNPNSVKSNNLFEVDPKEDLAEKLNNAAFTYFEIGGRNEDNLKTALKWSEKSISLSNENPALLDTYAHLLYVTGNRNKAISIQKEALALIKKLYSDQKEDPQVKEYISNFEKELKKMENGNL